MCVFQRTTPFDVVSELEGCEQGDESVCDVGFLTTGSEVLIFESGASRAFSLFVCLVRLTWEEARAYPQTNKTTCENNYNTVHSIKEIALQSRFECFVNLCHMWMF